MDTDLALAAAVLVSRLLRRGGARVAVPIPSVVRCPPTPSIPSPGWFNRHAVIIPIARIQVVDTEAGPLEQLLKLATVTVTTASSAGTIRIAGLDAAAAAQVAADLTIATARHTGDAT